MNAKCGSQGCLVEQRQRRLVNLMESWGLCLISFASRLFSWTFECCLILFEDCNTKKSKTGQEASVQVTEGLAPNKCRFLPKADAFTFRYLDLGESKKCILVEELRSVLLLFWSQKMTSESLMSSPFGPHTFSFLICGEIAMPWVSVKNEVLIQY